MKIMIPILFLLLFIMGCGDEGEFKADSFSKDDMCIVQLDTDKGKICYGMARSDVESFLGTGEESGFKITEYTAGVLIMYRNDIVAGITLDQNSKGRYKTARGAVIGMSKAEIKRLYGEENAIEHGERNLDYFYDSASNRFVTDLPSGKNQTQEEMVSTYILSVIMDSEAVSADRMMLLDARMAIYFQ
ncbi:hypothetical protein KZ483_17075 [Paenibacillus sp. sptzw28]|uniref:hypothetical protein n=1 Tax=Paenibacillus sp. sptzw28 TaxID=715179 RepID=UPI001C6E20A8|nr:hypothetical protein [Paenibacillus sp. sptzw28]QYR19607.1 hypothetical protein KZ483_17075 [Paenibacillus sp. sptzw28]